MNLYFFLLLKFFFTMTKKKRKALFLPKLSILKLQFLQTSVQWPVVPNMFTHSSRLSTSLSLDVKVMGCVVEAKNQAAG